MLAFFFVTITDVTRRKGLPVTRRKGFPVTRRKGFPEGEHRPLRALREHPEVAASASAERLPASRRMSAMGPVLDFLRSNEAQLSALRPAKLAPGAAPAVGGWNVTRGKLVDQACAKISGHERSLALEKRWDQPHPYAEILARTSAALKEVKALRPGRSFRRWGIEHRELAAA